MLSFQRQRFRANGDSADIDNIPEADVSAPFHGQEMMAGKPPKEAVLGKSEGSTARARSPGLACYHHQATMWDSEGMVLK